MQVLRHDIQKKEIEYVKHKHVILLLGLLNRRIPGGLFREDGEPNKDYIEKLVFIFYFFLLTENFSLI